MIQGERIRELRKTLNLTLEKFGEKLGVTKTTISRLENNINNVTEQMAKSICREFNVNYVWLTTGNGEMFVDTDDTTLAMVDDIMDGENDFHKNLLKACASLDDEELRVIKKIIDKFLEINKARN